MRIGSPTARVSSLVGIVASLVGCFESGSDEEIEDVAYSVTAVSADPNGCGIDVSGLPGTSVTGTLTTVWPDEESGAPPFFTFALDGLFLGERVLDGRFIGDDLDLGGIEYHERDFAPDFDCVREEKIHYLSNSGSFGPNRIDLVLDVDWTAMSGTECAQAHAVEVPCYSSVVLELD